MIAKIITLFMMRFETPISYAERIGVNLGKNVLLSTKHFSSEPYLITIGDNCRIAKDVRFFTHGGAWCLRIIYNDPELDYFGKISIGNNTHIGELSLIMPGVTIGNNCIIGAGSVVTKCIPDNTVAAGNPIRVVGKTEDTYHNFKKYDLKIKHLSDTKKKKYLLSLPENRFISKKMI